MCQDAHPEGVGHFADTPPDESLAAAMAQCAKDAKCKNDIERLIPKVAGDIRSSEREVRDSLKDCKVSPAAANMCARLLLSAVTGKFERVTDRLLGTAPASCKLDRLSGCTPCAACIDP